MKKIIKLFLISFIIIISVILSSCSNNNIKFYNINTKNIESLNVEDYIAGVVAGEIDNNWPIEAIKAQCIIARTFTYEFLQNKKSKYEGADISNDITEAQAYNKDLINDNIKQALKETKGLVLKYNNEFINAYFHSNSGGVTELTNTGFNNTDKNPSYIKSVYSPENKINSKNFEWEYTFTKSEILKALSEMGVEVTTINNIQIQEKSNTGRAINIKFGDKTVNANTFRLNIGSTKLKSTLINNISISQNEVTFKGNGYGHGVGLSQWGAKVLADQGKDFNYIINYYYDNIQIVKI